MTLSLLLALSALAFEAPDLVPGQHVYLVPEDQALPMERSLGATEVAAHPAYVIVAAQVQDQALDPRWSSHTEEALEDTWAHWSTDPAFDLRESSLVLVSLDEREVRIRAGARWDAELDLHTDALSELTDEHFVPLARAGDMDGALASTVEHLDAEIDARLVSQDRAAKWARVRPWLLGGLGGMGFLVLGGFGLFVAGVPRREARRRFREEVAEWEQDLAHARDHLAGFRVDTETRDRILELRLKGEVTTALFGSVTRALDEVELGLAALEDHLARCVAQAGDKGDREHWEAALARLESAVVVERVPERVRLFSPLETEVTVEPQDFMGRLEQLFATAHEGWDRLQDAVEASLSRAEADLPPGPLAELLERLATVDLGAAWVSDHPLLPEAQPTWAELDALRTADPVAYLDRLDELLDREQALIQDADGLLVDLQEEASLREKVRAALAEPLDTLAPTPDLDPVPAAAQAEQATAVLEAALAGPPSSLARLRELAEAAEALWLEARQRRDTLVEALEVAPGLIQDVSRRLDVLARQVDGHRAALAELLQEHLPDKVRPAMDELTEAMEDLDQARDLLASARAALEGKVHLEALELAGLVRTELTEAQTDLAELVAVARLLNAQKAEAEAALAALDRRRGELVLELGRYGGFASSTDLSEGDRLRAGLSWSAGPTDWEARTRQVSQVLTLWRRDVRQARERWEIEQRRLAAERRRQAAARAARRSSSYSSSSSYRSSSFSSRSSSSRSSFSSRSRSGGSSFRSRGRSGGSSFRSRGRSGGSRW